MTDDEIQVIKRTIIVIILSNVNLLFIELFLNSMNYSKILCKLSHLNIAFLGEKYYFSHFTDRYIEHIKTEWPPMDIS